KNRWSGRGAPGAERAAVWPARPGARLLDAQPARAAALLLGQGELQHAVLVARLALVGVDFRRQLDAARHRAVVALRTQHALAFLLLVELLDFGAQADLVAVDGDMNVVLVHAGTLGLDAVALVGFLDVDADLRG